MATINILPNGNVKISIPHQLRIVSSRKYAIVQNDSKSTKSILQDIRMHIAKAQKWWDMLKCGHVTNANEIAKKNGLDPSNCYRFLRLAHLSPFIIEAITSGNLPDKITISQLIEVAKEPIWQEQHKQIGLCC